MATTTLNALIASGLPNGPQGYQGAQGYQGNQGYQGAQGYQGNQGYQGAQGNQGAQGYQSSVPGPQGSSGIVSPTSSSADPSTIALRTSNADIFANNFYSISDVYLKENILVISNSLDKLSNINGVTYNFINSTTPQIGLIAQEVEKEFPEVVSLNYKGYKTISYGHLVSVLITAVNDLNKEVIKLKQLIK